MSSSHSKQPDSPTFFVDRALGNKIVPSILKGAGFLIEIHSDHFKDDATDIEWLAEVGKRGWVVLSKDKLIRKRPLERNALLDAKVAAFILTSGSLTGEEMGEIFIRARNRMLKLLEKHPKPFIATVTRSGEVGLSTQAGTRRKAGRL